LDRETALRMWTENVTWFSNEEGRKGNIAVGQLADLAVLDRDYFTVPLDEIQHLQSVLTLVNGRPVYGAGGFADLAPPPPPVLPEWSPVRTFGGYQKQAAGPLRAESVELAAASACGCTVACGVHGHAHARAWATAAPVSDARSFWGALGCACWAV
ncbi:MAG TPA: amidohydrolase family protein, partial [Geminicoccus sp.]|uniref:amidohydrolase family protein n=1 Tax=Geminicoccus sp. TaxID=2024832 RepID=UPI002E37E193